ncbi:MAG: glycogen-binding domain-containing protein [Planctomycetota bacterium]
MVEPQSDGSVQFRVFVSEADRVEVRGSFTSWDSDPLALEREPDADGWWVGSLTLPPGLHEFQYVIDGEDRLADYAANGVRQDAFGAWVSQLVVEHAGPGVIGRIQPDVPAAKPKKPADPLGDLPRHPLAA